MNLLIILNFLLMPLESTGEIDFVIDFAFFRVKDTLTCAEVYYEIPYITLTYEEVEEGFVAPIEFFLEVKDGSGKKVVEDRWNTKCIIPSYQDAEKRQMKVVDEMQLFLSPDSYRLYFKVEDLNSGKKGIVNETVDVPSFEEEGLTMSDIELAFSIESTSTKGKFYKNGLKVVPNAAREYNLFRPLLYSYCEIYNLSFPGSFAVKYSIFKKNKKFVKSLPEKIVEKPGESAVEAGAINVVGLRRGDYILKIEVTDLETKHSVQKERNFKITPFRIQPQPELAEYYNMIEYLLSEKDLKFYNSLSDNGKEEYRYHFWKKNDPIPGTEENEFLTEFAEMIKEVDKKFSTPLVKGRDSEMGKIYIKYGPPDEIDRQPLQFPYKAYESWLYYSGGGKQFIFVDLKGVGNYELVYSSVIQEPTRADWQNLIDPSIIQIRR